jgi:glycosyltransferase involved in cell wall biosynthesis
MKPKISIITVAYNAEKYIENTIQSVLSQTYDNVEYIVIDGQSTDKTLDICKRYKSKIDVLVSEPDAGLYDAMNKGIKAATGDVIGILNADDFYNADDVLSNVAEAFENQAIDCLYGDLVYVEADNTAKVTRKWTSGNYQVGAFLKGWMPPHPTFYIRKKYYNTFGTYSLDLKSSADYELMLRMMHKHNLKPYYLKKVMVRMRVGGVSNASFKNRLRANSEDKLAWEMNQLKPGVFTLIRKPLSKVLQFFRK